VAKAGDHAPAGTADAQLLAILQPDVRFRHGRHQRWVIVTAAAHLFQHRLVGQAMTLEVGDRGRAVHAGQRGRHHPGEAEFPCRDPERRAEPLAQPAGQPHVVGMAMGREHTQQRLAGQGAGEQLLPGGAGRVGAGAAIDHARAGAVVDLVLEQPEVDVVERERQRHARPGQAGRDRVQRAGRWYRVAEGIGQLGLERVHAAIFRVRGEGGALQCA
jgi:hypothetical protein